jgi:hypothetical protein
MPVRPSLLAASVVALSMLAGAAPAAAACKTMGFTVNDYGKDGPTKDAKELLDKEIAKWAADNGVAKYTVGKKTVKCELFLDVILFDEHTCTASASVCWGEGSTPPKAKDAAKKGEPKAAETAAPANADKPPVETGTITQDAAPAAAAQDDAAERAAAAAERAAAAAERAAAAAEKAAGSGTAEAPAATEQGSATDDSAPAAPAP